MDRNFYILDEEHRVIAVPMLTWARWLENFDNRRVALDTTQLFEVSTVFLGCNHGWGKGPPILFETMVFERQAEIKKIFGKLMPVRNDTECFRYSSWDDAVTGHQSTLRRLQKTEDDALAKLPKLRAKRQKAHGDD
jgi:hypothetical protein